MQYFENIYPYVVNCKHDSDEEQCVIKLFTRTLAFKASKGQIICKGTAYVTTGPILTNQNCIQ